MRRSWKPVWDRSKRSKGEQPSFQHVFNSWSRMPPVNELAWRKDMERRGLAPATIRRKLSALSSLFDYLCERNAVTGNPVDGVKRPMANGNEGSTPALGDAQARKLLEAPPADTLKGVRDRAILATLLYHGIRREELCGLRVKDLHSRQGVMHFRVKGKRSKTRFVPVNPNKSQNLIPTCY